MTRSRESNGQCNLQAVTLISRYKVVLQLSPTAPPDRPNNGGYGLRGVSVPRGEKWRGLCLPKTAKLVHRAKRGKA